MKRKRTSPRLPLWIDDFQAHLQDTQEPTVATGARVRLWCVAYRRGGYLPTDDDQLARWAGLSPEEWGAIRHYLVDSWTRSRDGSRYLIKRVRAAVHESRRKSAAQSANAQAKYSGQKSKQDNEIHTLADDWDSHGSPSPSPISHLPSPSPSPSKEKIPPGGAKRTQRAHRRTDPPPAAVEAFREAAHRYPNKAGWDPIIAKVGDRIDEWREHVRTWVLKGWNPANVQGMLETFGVPGALDRHGTKDEPKGFAGIREFMRDKTPMLDKAMEVQSGD